MKTNWNYPTTIWVGENRIQDLSIACKNLKKLEDDYGFFLNL